MPRDSGRAFPSERGSVPMTSATGHDAGMTLRDYFAAKAMGGMCSTPTWPMPQDAGYISARAYAIADAMLIEREKEDANGVSK